MTAIAFPGQGSQFVGMSRDFYDNFSEVREIYELIQDVIDDWRNQIKELFG